MWWRMVASRAGASTSARTTSPSEREPDSTRPRCTISSPAGAWVVRTRRRAVGAGDPAAVAHLPPPLGVEGGAVEDDPHVVF